MHVKHIAAAILLVCVLATPSLAQEGATSTGATPTASETEAKEREAVQLDVAGEVHRLRWAVLGSIALGLLAGGMLYRFYSARGRSSATLTACMAGTAVAILCIWIPPAFLLVKGGECLRDAGVLVSRDEVGRFNPTGIIWSKGTEQENEQFLAQACARERDNLLPLPLGALYATSDMVAPGHLKPIEIAAFRFLETTAWTGFGIFLLTKVIWYRRSRGAKSRGTRR